MISTYETCIHSVQCMPSIHCSQLCHLQNHTATTTSLAMMTETPQHYKLLSFHVVLIKLNIKPPTCFLPRL